MPSPLPPFPFPVPPRPPALPPTLPATTADATTPAGLHVPPTPAGFFSGGGGRSAGRSGVRGRRARRNASPARVASLSRGPAPPGRGLPPPPRRPWPRRLCEREPRPSLRAKGRRRSGPAGEGGVRGSLGLLISFPPQSHPKQPNPPPPRLQRAPSAPVQQPIGSPRRVWLVWKWDPVPPARVSGWCGSGPDPLPAPPARIARSPAPRHFERRRKTHTAASSRQNRLERAAAPRRDAGGPAPRAGRAGGPGRDGRR